MRLRQPELQQSGSTVARIISRVQNDPSDEGNSINLSDSIDEANVASPEAEQKKLGQVRKKKRADEGDNSRNQVAGQKKIALNLNKQGDNMNYKRSIEIKNGIALRSINNFHKTTNEIMLHRYDVSASHPFYHSLPSSHISYEFLISARNN